jgi:hypothetical protein
MASSYNHAFCSVRRIPSFLGGHPRLGQDSPMVDCIAIPVDVFKPHAEEFGFSLRDTFMAIQGAICGSDIPELRE